jgi:hypothetical protein
MIHPFGGKASIVEALFNGRLKQIMETAFFVKGFDPEDDLENFGRKIKIEPEFTWSNTPNPIGIQLLILIKVVYLRLL